jgi:uncharacterized protein (DUF488 family)
MESKATVWTIGHSNRSAEDFVATLEAFGIETVADVRRFPGSRRHPQFGSEALAATLAARGIDYAWVPGLGGRRRAVPGPAQLGWRNASFRSYAAHMWTEDFAEGLAELLHLASARRTAMMCSEVLWWRCHRALVSDALRLLGHEVVHIFDPAHATPHAYTSPARVIDGELSYPQQ